MFLGIKTESVNASVNISEVCVCQKLCNVRVLGVEVAAVALDRGILLKRLTPAAGGLAVIVFAHIVIAAVDTLQNIKASLEL